MQTGYIISSDDELQLYNEINKYLNSISDIERQIIIGYFYNILTNKEISNAIGLEEAEVNRIIDYQKEALRDIINKNSLEYRRLPISLLMFFFLKEESQIINDSG